MDVCLSREAVCVREAGPVWVAAYVCDCVLFYRSTASSSAVRSLRPGGGWGRGWRRPPGRGAATARIIIIPAARRVNRWPTVHPGRSVPNTGERIITRTLRIASRNVDWPALNSITFHIKMAIVDWFWTDDVVVGRT